MSTTAEKFKELNIAPYGEGTNSLYYNQDKRFTYTIMENPSPVINVWKSFSRKPFRKSLKKRPIPFTKHLRTYSKKCMQRELYKNPRTKHPLLERKLFCYSILSRLKAGGYYININSVLNSQCTLRRWFEQEKV